MLSFFIFFLKVLLSLYVIGFFATIIGLIGKDLMYRVRVGFVTLGLVLVLAVFWPYYLFLFMEGKRLERHEHINRK